MKKNVLSYPGSWVRQATHAFSRKLFSIVEVNCRFIDIHQCFRSILNIFHNKNIQAISLNATTTVINT
jgi:hypothetical protein